MGARRLAANVVVRNPEGVAVVLLDGTVPPDWAAGLITNPEAWADDAPASTASPVAPSPASGPPPKGGAGSGRDAWVEYAANRVELDEDTTRDDIISALDAAGIPTD